MDEGRIVESGLPSQLLPRLALQFQDDLSDSLKIKRQQSVLEDDRNVIRRMSCPSAGDEEINETGIQS